MKKKLIAVAAAALMVVALAGCSISASSSGASVSASGAASTAATEAKLVNAGTLTVGTSPDYPPFENLEGDQIVGFEVDLVNAVADKLGLKVEYKSMNFDSIIAAVEAGTQIDLGMSGFSITPERAKEIDFTTSFYTDDLGVATLKDGQFTTADSLNADGVRIAVQSGTTGESSMKENYPNAEVISYTSSNDIFAALTAGKADAACTNISVVGAMLNGSYNDCAMVKKIPSGEDYGLVVAKTNPALTEQINGALDELTNDGTIDALLEKWELNL